MKLNKHRHFRFPSPTTNLALSCQAYAIESKSKDAEFKYLELSARLPKTSSIGKNHGMMAEFLQLKSYEYGNREKVFAA